MIYGEHMTVPIWLAKLWVEVPESVRTGFVIAFVF